MTKHWSEILSCRCGKTFLSHSAESIHRHSFPSLCKNIKNEKETKSLKLNSQRKGTFLDKP